MCDCGFSLQSGFFWRDFNEGFQIQATIAGFVHEFGLNELLLERRLLDSLHFSFSFLSGFLFNALLPDLVSVQVVHFS